MQNRPKQTGPLVDEKSSDHDILAELLRINRETLRYAQFFTVLLAITLVVALIVLIVER